MTRQSFCTNGSATALEALRTRLLPVGISPGHTERKLSKFSGEVAMGERSCRAVLVAEAHPRDARQVVSCLLAMDCDVYLAMSREEVFRWLNRRVFRRAVVAAELMIGGEMLIARLSRLPAVKSLIAVGPAGDLEMEARCRAAGAKAYIGRPVTAEMLAAMLNMPMRYRNHHSLEQKERS